MAAHKERQDSTVVSDNGETTWRGGETADQVEGTVVIAAFTTGDAPQPQLGLAGEPDDEDDDGVDTSPPR